MPAMLLSASALGAVLLALASASSGAAPPETLRPLDTRPDRGNQEGAAYITGPTSPIQGFTNDDLEISFWQGPSPLAFSLAKNDVWDRRYFGARKQIVDIDAVRAMCFGGQIPASNGPVPASCPQALYLAYDFPCPKPAGQVMIRCPDVEGAPWTAGATADGALAVNAKRGPAHTALSAFLCRTRNLLVIHGDYSGLTQPLQVQLFRHQDTTPQGTSIAGLAHFGGDTQYDYSQDPDNGPLPPPEAGQDGRFFWIRQEFPAEATFPHGFGCVLMGTLRGAPAEMAAGPAAGAGVPAVIHPLTDDAYARLPGWLKEIRIAAERVNNAASGSLATATITGPRAAFDLLLTVVTTRDAADPLAAARGLLEDAVREGPEALALESAAATDDAVRAWRNSRVMHYNATSCTYLDATPWHGDYHFNEGYLTSDIVAGRAADLEPRLRMFEELLPALQRNAREVYHCGGAAFSLVHYPIKTDRVVYSNFTWEWGLENTALMLQPFWQVYQYTQDREFLQKRAYPTMREGARFYADYVTKGDDGLYHVIPTVSQEHWGWTPEWKLNRDSVGALSFVKYHLRACTEASEVLGVDADERARWRDIVEHLAPYPTLDTPGGPVFCDVRDAPELLNYNITANLVMVLWAEDISLDSPPELLDLAPRSYEALPDKEHSMRPDYLQQIRLFLGMPTEPDLSPQGRVLSWPGRIHLYAGVPRGVALSDQFAGYLAVGGFEVAARHVGTEVRGVRITSRAGRPCRVRSPWDPNEVAVLDFAGRRRIPHTTEGDTIVFATEAGHTYALLAGDELPLAAERYVADGQVVGQWTFDRAEDRTVRDTSHGGHDARLVGQAQMGQEGSLALDGDGSYAQVERFPALDFAANQGFSVEARVKLPAALPPPMTPLVCSMDLKQYCLLLDRGRPKLYLSSPAGDVFCQASGSTLLTDGRWHTVRGVRDVSDQTVRVYVDGKLEGSAPDTTGGDFASTAPLTIGAYLWGDNTRYARGLIAEVEIRSLGRLVSGP